MAWAASANRPAHSRLVRLLRSLARREAVPEIPIALKLVLAGLAFAPALGFIAGFVPAVLLGGYRPRNTTTDLESAGLGPPAGVSLAHAVLRRHSPWSFVWRCVLGLGSMLGFGFLSITMGLSLYFFCFISWILSFTAASLGVLVGVFVSRRELLQRL